MHSLSLSGTGLYTPSAAISNDELVAAFNAFVRRHNADHAAAIAEGRMAALVESSSEFILKASGIKSRYVMDRQGILDPDILCPRLPERPNEQISILAEMAVTAARDALKAADRKPSEIDGVIVACSNLQRAYPAIAIEVQDALGIAGFGFDMNVACSSATFGLQAAGAMVETGQARAVLVCNPEICSGHLNFRDRDSHFIFGDVATAFVVEPRGRGLGRECVGNRVDAAEDAILEQYPQQFRLPQPHGARGHRRARQIVRAGGAQGVQGSGADGR